MVGNICHLWVDFLLLGQSSYASWNNYNNLYFVKKTIKTQTLNEWNNSNGSIMNIVDSKIKSKVPTKNRKNRIKCCQK